MANKKITLKNKAGEKLYPSTIMEQVVGINEALDGKLGKTEKAASASSADVANTVIDGSISTSKIATAAITPAKIQTSIALNGTPSMTVEPTTSSPDKTIASVGLVKEVMEDIEIGGRNLILNGDFSRGAEHWTNVYWGTTISSEENMLRVDIKQTANQFGVNTSPISLENRQQYVASFDVKSDDITSLDYCYLRSSLGNIRLSSINGITSEWQRLECKFTAMQTGSYSFSFGSHNLSTEISQNIQFRKVKIEKGNKATDWSPAPEDIKTEISNAETRSKSHAEDYTDAEITKIENGETVAQKANSLYDEDSGDWKIWKDVTNAVGDEVEEVLKQNNFATKDDIQSIIPSNATETGAGIVRAATQAEVNDGHVSDNDPSEMAFVRPETLQSKLSNYPTTTAMTQAISESKEEVKGVVSAMDFPIEQVQGLKEALDGKLPLSGGTLTGNITAPSFKTNLTSGVAEAVMAYPVNISWGNDLNSDTYLKAGMYRTSSATSTVNQPNEKGHSNLLTIRGNESDNIAQMFFDYWNNGKVFTRVGSITVDTTSTSHIFNRDWKQLRTMNDLVTTSHIATAAITPAKIQTSIALNGTPSMTVEPTTSSPDKAIASVGLAKQVVEDIEIGGRNLILNSDFSKGVSYWNPAYDASTVLFSVENNIATFTLGVSDATVLQTSAILFEVGQEYTVSFDCRSDEYTALDYCYFIGQEGQGNKSFYIYGITSEWKRIIYTFTSEISGLYRFGFGTNRNRNTAGSFQLRNVKIEKGNKATDWTPAPEDIKTEISNAETRSKSHAEDYTDAEITKIENGETVAQKANSLYDEDSGDWKIWKDVTNAVGDEVEEVLKQNNFATKDDIQSIIPSNATETGAGIVRAATQAEVNDGHVSDNDPSEMAFVRPETLDSYIDSKGFATTSDISDALASAKPAIFFQAAQPAGGKDGDIWIIP